jgi:hypothetical protein
MQALCIHPFRDGNGRVSRLALLLQAYGAGMEVGRYISLERLIEQNKDRYYETLEQCSFRWHEGRHDPWPFIIEHACPGVGREWIRTVLADMRKDGELECKGRGVAARWSVRPKQS